MQGAAISVGEVRWWTTPAVICRQATLLGCRPCFEVRVAPQLQHSVIVCFDEDDVDYYEELIAAPEGEPTNYSGQAFTKPVTIRCASLERLSK